MGPVDNGHFSNVSSDVAAMIFLFKGIKTP